LYVTIRVLDSSEETLRGLLRHLPPRLNPLLTALLLYPDDTAWSLQHPWGQESLHEFAHRSTTHRKPTHCWRCGVRQGSWRRSVPYGRGCPNDPPRIISWTLRGPAQPLNTERASVGGDEVPVEVFAHLRGPASWSVWRWRGEPVPSARHWLHLSQWTSLGGLPVVSCLSQSIRRTLWTLRS
jgi:hypothetical protein